MADKEPRKPRHWDAGELARRDRDRLLGYDDNPWASPKEAAKAFRTIAAERASAGNPPPTSEHADRIPR
ncbi:MAG: hypothetical protein WEA10_05020 [Actinomycetota bacterium]